MDELRDRAAVRTCERGHPRQRAVPLARVHVADHARHPDRLRRRQAGRHPGRVAPRDEAESRTSAPAGRLGGARRRRLDRRDRLHRRAVDRRHCVPGSGARGGQARRAQRRALRLGADVARLPRDRAPAEAPAHSRAARHSGDADRSRGAGRSRARSHSRPQTGAGHARRVRGLRVPLLRAGRVGAARAASRLGRRPLRLAPPAAQRRPPERGARGRGERGCRGARRVLGGARPPARASGRPDANCPDGLRARARARRRSLRRRSRAARRRRPGRRGC